MKLKFFNPNQLDKNLKATIHKSSDKSIGIAVNEEDLEDNNFYLVVYPDKQSGAFNINKAGSYYYLNTKPLFDNLKLDYITNAITFDIIEETIDSQKVFIFKKRTKLNKKQDNNEK